MGVRNRMRRVADGAAAVEYGVVCGAAVGIGGVLWKLLTSSFGHQFIESIFTAVKGQLPF